MVTSRRRRPVTGFTFVEVLAVTAVLGGLVGTLLLMLLMGRTSYDSAEASIQVQQEARRALDAVGRELREAGQVNNNVSIGEPGVQQLDFQVSRGYDSAGCGGVCWGTNEPGLPDGWLHYVVDAADARNIRMMRCATAGRLDAMPAGWAGCRVVANALSGAVADTAFTYDDAARLVTLRVQARLVSTRLAGGSAAASPAPLVSRVSLRNP